MEEWRSVVVVVVVVVRFYMSSMGRQTMLNTAKRKATRCVARR